MPLILGRSDVVLQLEPLVATQLRMDQVVALQVQPHTATVQPVVMNLDDRRGQVQHKLRHSGNLRARAVPHPALTTSPAALLVTPDQAITAIGKVHSEPVDVIRRTRGVFRNST